MLAASKDDIVYIIRSTARFGETYALRKYDAIIAAAQDAAVLAGLSPATLSGSAFISILIRNTRSI